VRQPVVKLLWPLFLYYLLATCYDVIQVFDVVIWVTNSISDDDLTFVFACVLGPFYVMMAPQDVLQSTGLGQRTLVPRSGIIPKLEPGSRITRDDRRRATHNEGWSDELMLKLLTNNFLSAVWRVNDCSACNGGKVISCFVHLCSWAAAARQNQQLDSAVVTASTWVLYWWETANRSTFTAGILLIWINSSHRWIHFVADSLFSCDRQLS